MDKSNIAITPADFERNRLYRGNFAAMKKRYTNIVIHKKKKEDGGAFSNVYKAFDTQENKDKAIKLIEACSTEENMIDKVRNELHNLAQI